MYSVLLAGGSGTRFWPRSRETLPKQLLHISGKGTLIQNTLERLLPLIPIRNTFVVTHELHAVETCRQLVSYGFSPSNLLAEPMGRNTAAAIGFAAKILMEKSPEEAIGVFPADHIIENPDRFLEILKQAEKVANQGHLVTLGIEPARPETGYGYIQKGDSLEFGSFRVERFVEKPDSSMAEKFFKEDRYLWNSGMFIWQVSSLLKEIETHLPGLYDQLDSIVSHTRENKGKFSYWVLDTEGRNIYESLDSVSIDHGIMEKTKHCAVIPADLKWTDVGSWSSMEEIMEKDADGNVKTGNILALDSTGSIVQGTDRLIATLGIKDLLVVDTPDALLICDKTRAQDVKKIVEQMNQEHRPEVKTHPTVLKPWGSYTNLEVRKNYLVKRIEVQPGEKLSLQSHTYRDEHWTVVSGTAEIQLENQMMILNPNETTLITRGSKHRLGNPGETPLILIEVQVGDQLDENDIVRYDDLYGRS